MDLSTHTAEHRLRGRLLVVAAAVLWSTSGFFAKAPLFESWPAEQRGVLLAFWRALFACLLVMPLVRRPRWSPGLVPMVTLFVIMNYTFLAALTFTTAANAIWLQNVAPVWVFLIGVFLFGEPVRRGDWTLVVLGGLGVGLIVLFEAQGEQLSGTLFGLAAGLTYAGVILSIRQLRGHDTAWLIALNLLITSIVLFPLVLYHNVWPTGRQWIYLAAFGAFQLGLPYYLFARGVKSLSGHEASGIALLEPVLVPVWVYLAWHSSPTYQPPRAWTFVGGGLILTALLLKFVRAEVPDPKPRRQR
jgi:drug/metabolite transporter (DMT)-like permease